MQEFDDFDSTPRCHFHSITHARTHTTLELHELELSYDGYDFDTLVGDITFISQNNQTTS